MEERTRNGRRALVTGGAGFIGSHLAGKLLEQGWEVVVLDNLSVGKREKVPEGCEFIQGDVLDRGLLKKICSEVEVVFHQAARVSVRSSMQDFYEDGLTNVLGTLSLLEACKAGRVKKIIFASSMAVYADSRKGELVDETYQTLPLSPYGVSKLAAERYLLTVCPPLGIDGVILRYFNTYGIGQTFTPYVGVITIFINRLLKGEPPVIFGDGNQIRDFVHVSDIVQANLKALDPSVTQEIFNVGTGVGTSVNELADLLCRKINPGIRPIFGEKRPGEISHSVADISKIRRKLDYRPQYRLHDKIDEVIESIKKGSSH